MDPMVEWIAAHALRLWALLLLLALLTGDLAWRHNARWQRHALARGHAPIVLRWQVGLILLLALALLFLAIASAIAGQPAGELARFDADLAESLHAQLPLPALRGIAVVTHLGDQWWVAPASAVVALFLLLRRHWRLAGIWVVALLGILPINGGLKTLFQRVRPLHDHGFIVERGWSFPSGHAFGSIVFYGMLAYVLLRLLPQRFHRATIAAAVLLVSVVGISRILLQVHYFSDVMAGYAAGAAWLVLCIGAAEHLGRPAPGVRP
ncbi:phosphatase PAP2 family protein [Rhodanobacter denitrificans]|uniref:undecaprenyl-diphosphate phosphatase n=1 Tax=Rhodanobacter denitrificans TaxID=666685 RepID=M4NFY4_9GAMM|nr:phosphatase PAP2 family protein [Rhodanobacter denitrificans]AGG88548.1 membrane-associated phospholipid phosphatase [Rhodanobacter denitrificans]UJJ58781.1 phosphatase PAP2 family protein [Rhodanobacter denitrificans]UJM87686.1 phosphatase PAP2 family protein [Rhodanobacter denitrificans]